MDLYISKQCQHCTQLLILLKENPNLQPYFNVKPIETNPYPESLKVVPTLVKDGQLFTGNSLNEIVNDVYRYDMERNNQQPQQPQQQRNPQQKQPSQQMNNNDPRPQMQQTQPLKQENTGDGEIQGICQSEGCMFESIDNSDNNYLNGNYCFLDDGYSELKPSNTSNSPGEKTGRFDNSAYEQMMKSRGGM
jgi:hypothetical protein